MFLVSGKKSILKCDFFPPIRLDNKSDWELGLISLTTFNSIPNVEEGKSDSLHFGSAHAEKHTLPDAVGQISNETPKSRSTSTVNYSEKDNELLKGDINNNSITIVLPQGAYELHDINDYVRETCTRANIPLMFELKPNNNTLHSEIYANRPIDFTRENSLADMLGFKKRVLEAGKWHISDNTVNIIKVNSIRLVCNLVQGSFSNGDEAHILHEFPLAVEPGYKIIECPQTIIYMGLNTRTIHSLIIRLEDQSGDLINFAGENISIRLHLRRQQNGVDFSA
jgi:hypothetical protein